MNESARAFGNINSEFNSSGGIMCIIIVNPLYYNQKTAENRMLLEAWCRFRPTWMLDRKFYLYIWTWIFSATQSNGRRISKRQFLIVVKSFVFFFSHFFGKTKQS